MSIERAVLRLSPHVGKFFAAPLANACTKYGITEPIQQAHFLAQLGHESMGFSHLEENLNYSAERLLAVFPRYFRPASAAACAHNPEKIGNIIYSNRMGNGNEASGDGYRYRGRGLIHCTGRNNYAAFSLSYFGDTRAVQSPDILLQAEVAAMNAGWFWQRNGINKLVDEDSIIQCIADCDDIKSVTRAINGGLNGLDDRLRWLNLTKNALLAEAT